MQAINSNALSKNNRTLTGHLVKTLEVAFKEAKKRGPDTENNQQNVR